MTDDSPDITIDDAKLDFFFFILCFSLENSTMQETGSSWQQTLLYPLAA